MADLYLYNVSSSEDRFWCMVVNASDKKKLGTLTEELIEGQNNRIKIGEVEFMFIAGNSSVATIAPKWMAKK